MRSFRASRTEIPESFAKVGGPFTNEVIIIVYELDGVNRLSLSRHLISQSDSCREFPYELTDTSCSAGHFPDYYGLTWGE